MMRSLKFEQLVVDVAGLRRIHRGTFHHIHRKRGAVKSARHIEAIGVGSLEVHKPKHPPRLAKLSDLGAVVVEHDA